MIPLRTHSLISREELSSSSSATVLGILTRPYSTLKTSVVGTLDWFMIDVDIVGNDSLDKRGHFPRLLNTHSTLFWPYFLLKYLFLSFSLYYT